VEHIINKLTVARKPIFDAMRIILGRGFSQTEVEMIDRAIDRAVDTLGCPQRHRLGGLSAHYESGGRGAGAISSGSGDPGGVSYGTYQLSSKTGSVAAFAASEGARWSRDFAGALPGGPEFSAAWKAIAARQPKEFAGAQHAFIERTHYRPTIAEVLRRTGLDLDCRHPAVRDAAWSVAVQHGRAARILSAAVCGADSVTQREAPAYDRVLLQSVYAERSRYVSRLAARSNTAVRRTLESVVRHRYPAELSAALAMLESKLPT
jgi:hypothetical protein